MHIISFSTISVGLHSAFILSVSIFIELITYIILDDLFNFYYIGVCTKTSKFLNLYNICIAL